MDMKKINYFMMVVGLVVMCQFVNVPQVSAVASCCVYFEHIETLANPGDLETDYDCVDTNDVVVATTTASNNFACPSGASPDNLSGAFFVFDYSLTDPVCGQPPSGYVAMVLGKNNFYCSEGVKKQSDQFASIPTDSLVVFIGGQIDKSYGAIMGEVSENTLCCVPYDKSKTADATCHEPVNIRQSAKDKLFTYFFDLNTTLPLSDKFGSLFYCGDQESPTGSPDNSKLIGETTETIYDEDKYSLFVKPCDDQTALSTSAVPGYYVSAGFKPTVKAMCGSLADADLTKNNIPVGDKTAADKSKETEDTGGYKKPSFDLSVLNPIGTTSIQILFGRLIQIGLGVLGSAALIIFIYGGFLWMTAMGNAEQTSKALSTILWGSLGVIVILASYSIVGFVLSSFL
jgi:hypothetical protein